MKRTIHIEVVHMDQRIIYDAIINKVKELKWFFSSIYGSIHVLQKRAFSIKLMHISSFIQLLKLLMGDFEITLKLKERNRRVENHWCYH